MNRPSTTSPSWARAPSAVFRRNAVACRREGDAHRRQAMVDAIARDGLGNERASGSERAHSRRRRSGRRRRVRPRVVQREVIGDGRCRARDRAAPCTGAVVLGLQNGVENFDQLRSVIANPIVAAVVYVAVELGAWRPASQRPWRSCHRPAARQEHGVAGDLAAHLAAAKIRRASPTISTASCGRS